MNGQLEGEKEKNPMAGSQARTHLWLKLTGMDQID